MCILLHYVYRDSKTWNTSGIEGVHRFLGRTWRLIVGSPLPHGTFRDGTVATDEEPTMEQLRTLHKCIAKVMFYTLLTYVHLIDCGNLVSSVKKYALAAGLNVVYNVLIAFE